MKLEIRPDDGAAPPGQELTGHVHVHEGGSSRTLVLTLRFWERSASFSSTPFASGGVIHEGDLATGQAVDFRCPIPAWATPGVKGKHAELFWELEAVSDSPGLNARATTVVEIRAR